MRSGKLLRTAWSSRASTAGLVKLRALLHADPGDEIVGFVTRGYGVSIHRRDCVNVHMKEDPDQLGARLVG